MSTDMSGGRLQRRWSHSFLAAFICFEESTQCCNYCLTVMLSTVLLSHLSSGFNPAKGGSGSGVDLNIL
eukprot:5201666-Pleurochrysis_carterae.AAC.1